PSKRNAPDHPRKCPFERASDTPHGQEPCAGAYDLRARFAFCAAPACATRRKREATICSMPRDCRSATQRANRLLSRFVAVYERSFRFKRGGPVQDNRDEGRRGSLGDSVYRARNEEPLSVRSEEHTSELQSRG